VLNSSLPSTSVSNPAWISELPISRPSVRGVVEDTNMTSYFCVYKEPLPPSHSQSIYPTHSPPIYVSTGYEPGDATDAFKDPYSLFTLLKLIKIVQIINSSNARLQFRSLLSKLTHQDTIIKQRNPREILKNASFATRGAHTVLTSEGLLPLQRHSVLRHHDLRTS
jgi:hypothetical protein